MDLCGRKVHLITLIIPFLVSWLLIGFASSFKWLFLGMTIQGLGSGSYLGESVSTLCEITVCFNTICTSIGMASCTSTYISEISIASHRGLLLGGVQVAYNIGVLVSSILMYYSTWYTVAFTFASMAVASLLLIFFLPESPIWLYSKGKYDEAIDTLCKIRCTEKEKLLVEIKEIENFCGTREKKNWRTVVRNCWRTRSMFVVVMFLQIFLQHTGYGVMMAYTIMIVEKLQIPFSGTQITVAYSAASFIGSVFTPYFMHRIDKKVLLSIASLTMGTCMIVVAVYEELFYSKNEKPFVWIIPVVLFMYSLATNAGVLPVTSTICGELFPTEVNGTMSGICGLFGYFYWSVILKIYPAFISLFGIKIMIWVFGISSFMLCFYAIYVFPETRGKTLNQVQEQYLRKKGNACTEDCDI